MLLSSERRFMEVTSFNVNITSEDPELLKSFYGDILELPPIPEIGEGAFRVGGAALLIDGHSETFGRAREPQRVLINLFVDDVVAEREQLEARGVEFIRREGREFWGGLISTFLDPDGNYVQLIEFHPD
jgi:predicted enzyme related to lactoylglutathione lyase